MATTIRQHLKTKHEEEWKGIVVEEKLKGWQTVNTEPSMGSNESGEQEEFSVKGFLDRLVKWIVADDQSLNVVESKELRDLLLYVGVELKPDDIPHRSKLAQLIIEKYQEKHDQLKLEMQHQQNQISAQATQARQKIPQHSQVLA
ncbi:hypothetical protein JAAARDRAFT_210760 [Jaapia argillacea MUCL 33604]|uniref:Uncharacterized protein n=1 Tax=Jaapia argillacea MUCL 33604 TaxID=933084 RepID=A0A067PDT9_9AGAM|nr:hypothetical protein JAAARDRAFT_210760 [Jaapia argillacea MUCL 33604]